MGAQQRDLNEFLARQERERRAEEFFRLLDAEVWKMKYERMVRERQTMPFGLSFASHRNILRQRNTPLPVVKHDDRGESFVDVSRKKLVSIKTEIRKTGRRQLASVQTDLDVCYYCEIKLDVLTLDHIIPKSKGGPNSAYNLVYCCSRCNGLKSNRSLERFRAVVLVNDARYGLGQIALMCANIARLIHYRNTNALMINLRTKK